MYRRNQVEAALHALLMGAGRTAYTRVGERVPLVLRTRIKRLLEIDRRRGKDNAKSAADTPLAFFDTLPEGTGQDVSYSAFQAFRLAVALELVSFGCKQTEAVEQVALCLDRLTGAFGRATEVIRTHGRGTTTVVDPLPEHDRRSHIYLVITSVDASKKMAQAYPVPQARERVMVPEICSGKLDLHRYLDQTVPKETYKALILEVAHLAARIVELLELAPLRKRGRQS